MKNFCYTAFKKFKKRTRPAWSGFKTAEEGRAKIVKFQYIRDVTIINKKLYYRSFILEVILQKFYYLSYIKIDLRN
jgi:hypothetical protein